MHFHAFSVNHGIFGGGPPLYILLYKYVSKTHDHMHTLSNSYPHERGITCSYPNTSRSTYTTWHTTYLPDAIHGWSIHNNAHAWVEIWSYSLCCGMSGKLKTQKSSVTKLGSHCSKIMRNPMSRSKLHKLDGQPGNRTKQTQISNSELNQNHSKLFKNIQKQEMIINRFFESAF